MYISWVKHFEVTSELTTQLWPTLPRMTRQDMVIIFLFLWKQNLLLKDPVFRFWFLGTCAALEVQTHDLQTLTAP